MQSKFNSKVSIPIVIDEHGTLANNESESVGIFANSFFSSLRWCLMPVIKSHRNEVSLESITVTVMCVHVGGISFRIGYYWWIFANSFQGIFSFTWWIIFWTHSMGYIPSSRRQSTGTPFFKKGYKFEAENFVVKVLKRVICKRVLQFVLQKSIIPPQQQGFVPGRSIISYYQPSEMRDWKVIECWNSEGFNVSRSCKSIWSSANVETTS